MSYPASLMQLI